jgi:hypothetical protein
MADNVSIDPGTTTPIATDDVSGVHFQKIKLDLGADGLSSPAIGSVPVSAASLPLPTGAATAAKQPGPAATSSVTNVSGSATNVTVLAANASRIGAAVYNDDTKALYLKLGTVASATSFTVKMAAASYYEVPSWYTGAIDGIWEAGPTGSARVTEVSA